MEPIKINLQNASKEIEILSEMLLIPKENILVVGSLALLAHGFPAENIGDIDLEIKGLNDRTLKVLSLLKEASKSVDGKNYCSCDKRYDFTFRGFKFNVWIVDTFSHTFCWLNYIKYANPLSVIKVKLSYKRAKDFDYLNTLMNHIFSK